MDTNDPTNPMAEAPEAEAPEVELDETSDETLAAEDADEAEIDGEEPEEEEELDIDGNPVRLPKTLAEKLKARMMMQADYTQKTQALSEQRKEVDARRQALEWTEKTNEELFAEKAQLHTVRQRLDQYQNVNWQALQQQDPAKFGAAQAEYLQLRDFHDRLSGHVSGRETQLEQAREQETAIALSKAVEVLNKPNPSLGWDGKFDQAKRDTLTKFGVELGYSIEELENTTHPLMIQTLNLARIGAETLRKQSASLKRPIPEAKPVPQVATGKTKTGPFNPDDLPPDEWKKWRNTQIAKKQAKSR